MKIIGYKGSLQILIVNLKYKNFQKDIVGKE